MRNQASFERKNLLNIYTLNHLSLQIGIPTDELDFIFKNIKNEYSSKLKETRKNDGSIKVRQIYYSSKRLEAILKAIDNYLLKQIKLPAYVHGSRKTHDTLSNAKLHVGKKYVFSLDFENCYPNINAQKVRSLFKKLNCSGVALKYLVRLCTADNQLPQGYNTSPKIAVISMLPATDRIYMLCKKNGLTFTSFADDLTISANKDPSSFFTTIKRILSEHGISINARKTKCQKQSQRQETTGLVVNKKLNVTKEYYKTLRYNIHVCKKYGPSTLLGKLEDRNNNTIYTLEKLKPHLMGKLNYVKRINPEKTGKLCVDFNSIVW